MRDLENENRRLEQQLTEAMQLARGALAELATGNARNEELFAALDLARLTKRERNNWAARLLREHDEVTIDEAIKLGIYRSRGSLYEVARDYPKAVGARQVVPGVWLYKRAKLEKHAARSASRVRR